MAWLIYAVLRSPPPSLPALAGVEEAPLAIVGNADLCAAVSQHAAPPPASVAATFVFGDTVTALWERTDAVPMRFGSTFGARREVLAWLSAERDAFTALLRLVGGCTEIGIRFALAHPVCGERLVPSRGAGHAYLAARMRDAGGTGGHELAARGQAERLAAALTGGYRCWRFDGVSKGFVSVAFLVPTQHTGDFARECRRRAGEIGGPLYVSGPWPPYSFTAPPSPLTAERPSSVRPAS